MAHPAHPLATALYYQGTHFKIAMVGEASRAIENISASLEFKMHALKNCLLKNAFFFGPSLGPPAFASALPRQASGPRLRPQKSTFYRALF